MTHTMPALVLNGPGDVQVAEKTHTHAWSRRGRAGRRGDDNLRHRPTHHFR